VGSVEKRYLAVLGQIRVGENKGGGRMNREEKQRGRKEMNNLEGGKVRFLKPVEKSRQALRGKVEKRFIKR